LIVTIENDVPSAEIQKAHESFGEGEIRKLQEQLGKLTEEHPKIDARRKDANGSLTADQKKVLESVILQP
jgi:hypothetical protein